MLQSLEFPRDCLHIVVAHQAMEGVWRHDMVYCQNQCIETPYVLMEFHTRSAKFLMLKHIVGNPTTEGVGRHAAVRRIHIYIYIYIYIYISNNGNTVRSAMVTRRANPDSSKPRQYTHMYVPSAILSHTHSHKHTNYTHARAAHASPSLMRLLRDASGKNN